VTKIAKKANNTGDKTPVSDNTKSIITIDPTTGVIILDTGTTIIRIESPDQKLQQQNDKFLTKKILIGVVTAVPIIGSIMGTVGVLHDLGMFRFTPDTLHSSTPMTFHGPDQSRSEDSSERQISKTEIKHMSISAEASVVMTFGDDMTLVVKQVHSINKGLELLIYSPYIFYRPNTKTDTLHKDMLDYVRTSEKSFSDIIARVSVSPKENVFDIGEIVSVIKGMN